MISVSFMSFVTKRLHSEVNNKNQNEAITLYMRMKTIDSIQFSVHQYGARVSRHCCFWCYASGMIFVIVI